MDCIKKGLQKISKVYGALTTEGKLITAILFAIVVLLVLKGCAIDPKQVRRGAIEVAVGAELFEERVEKVEAALTNTNGFGDPQSPPPPPICRVIQVRPAKFLGLQKEKCTRKCLLEHEWAGTTWRRCESWTE